MNNNEQNKEEMNNQSQINFSSNQINNTIPSTSTPMANVMEGNTQTIDTIEEIETLNPVSIQQTNTINPINIPNNISNPNSNSIPNPNLQEDKQMEEDTNSATKSNKKMLVIIGVVLGFLIVIGIGCFIVIENFKKKEQTPPNDESIVEEQSVKVNFNNYIFDIPNTFDYNIKGSMLTINDNTNSWFAALGVLNGDYNNLKDKRSQIQTNFQNTGYNASSGVVKTFKGVEYLTFELISKGENVLAAYTRLDNNTVLYLSAANVNNQFDYTILENLSEIILSIQPNSVTFGIETPSEDSVSDILGDVVAE